MKKTMSFIFTAIFMLLLATIGIVRCELDKNTEPNGVFASKNTAATWVMCLGEAGNIEPVYVETKVTVYPGPVKVDYQNNRVTRSGAATVMIPKQ